MTSKHVLLEPISRRIFVGTILATATWRPSVLSAPGTAPASLAATLCQDVRIFDGRSARLSAPSNVLIVGDTIALLSALSSRSSPAKRKPFRGRLMLVYTRGGISHALMAGAPGLRAAVDG